MSGCSLVLETEIIFVCFLSQPVWNALMRNCYSQKIPLQVDFEEYHMNEKLCVNGKILHCFFIWGTVWVALHVVLFLSLNILLTFSWSRKLWFWFDKYLLWKWHCIQCFLSSFELKSTQFVIHVDNLTCSWIY